MSIRTTTATALMLGLVACSSTTSPEVKVLNTDPASLKATPGGVATIVFTDLETIRPDNIAAATTGSSCITVTPLSVTSFRYTFNGCQSASGGALSGTVTVTTTGTGTVTYSSLYDVTVTETTGTWHYTGTKLTTVDSANNTATIAIPTGQPMTVAYVNTSDAAKNKTWAYSPNLHADWSNANAVKFWGGYSFQQTAPAGNTISVTIAQATALTWVQTCAYPSSGVLTLSVPPASAEVRFNTSITDASVLQGCGVITLNGYRLVLGQ